MAKTKQAPLDDADDRGRSVIRNVRFTRKQWADIEARSQRLRMPPARFLAYAALRALEHELPDLQAVAGVNSLIQGA